MTPIEAVMPISAREPVRRHLERAVMCFDSLNFFWTSAAPLTINIVVPDAEHAFIKATFAPAISQWHQLKIVLLKESEVCPEFLDRPSAHGYAKQMVIKLAAPRFVHSQFYLTLDTDVVACREFSGETLIKNGLALTDWAIPTAPAWWRESAKLLDLYPMLDRPKITVTPLLLSSNIANDLGRHLTERFQCPWVIELIDRFSGQFPNVWTEYTLYQLFADHFYVMDKYHLPSAYQDDRLQSSENHLWSANQFETWKPEMALTGSGYFIVLQSLTANNLPFEVLRERWHDAMRKIHPEFRPTVALET